jgi:hypothetical protein
MTNQHTALPMPDRFWAKVDRSGGLDACWPWMGSRTEEGYGQFWDGQRIEHAARVAWRLHTGKEVPSDKHALHHCDNPPCCNPAHLWLGTNQNNSTDRARKGRTANQFGGNA